MSCLFICHASLEHRKNQWLVLFSSIFYSLHWCLARGLLPVDEMYIGETGNCGRQNCNLGNALAGRSTGHCSAVQCIVYITALGALHCTGHCTWHSNCTVFVLNWSLGTGHFYCSALGGSAIKINWANIAAANWPTPLSIKQGCCVLDWAT